MNKLSKDEWRPKGFLYSTRDSEPFQKVLASFEQLNSVEDPIRLDFEHRQTASGLRLTTSRSLYMAWNEQNQGGQQ